MDVALEHTVQYSMGEPCLHRTQGWVAQSIDITWFMTRGSATNRENDLEESEETMEEERSRNKSVRETQDAKKRERGGVSVCSEKERVS